MFRFVLLLALVLFTAAEWIKEMENSNLYQGDIELDPDEKEVTLGNTYGSIKGGRWPGARIPYYISTTVASNIRPVILKAIAEYEKNTCLRFVRRTRQTSYLNFRDGGGCSSPVGYRSGRANNIFLSSRCFPLGTVLHEIGHSIGLQHEQSRPDRDSYVTIVLGNINSNMRFNFDKKSYSQVDSLQTPYDYDSMMHYGKTAFGNGRVTIITKQSYYQDRIGQRKGFSKVDIQQINEMYCKCKDNITI